MTSPSNLRAFSASLRDLPRTVGIKVATAAAPAITAAAAATFAAGADPYGVAWTPGADGQAVTLRKTGALARGISYTAIGTKIRVVLGVRYAKYQIGRRPVFPRQGAPLPRPYVDALTSTSRDVIATSLAAGGAA